jgi:hypothetical protein
VRTTNEVYDVVGTPQSVILGVVPEILNVAVIPLDVIVFGKLRTIADENVAIVEPRDTVLKLILSVDESLIVEISRTRCVFENP